MRQNELSLSIMEASTAKMGRMNLTKLERAVETANMDFVEKGQSRIISIKYSNGEAIIDGDKESVNELLNSPFVEDVRNIVTKVCRNLNQRFCVRCKRRFQSENRIVLHLRWRRGGHQ